jgi:hypothetical protein
MFFIEFLSGCDVLRTSADSRLFASVLKDQTSMGFIHGLARLNAHDPHPHWMQDMDDRGCGSPPKARRRRSAARQSG